MKLNQLLKLITVATALTYASPAYAQTIITWTGGDGDFFDGKNWDTGAFPKLQEIALINNGKTATIAANAGDHELGTIRIGDDSGGTGSGHVIMNGGFLKIGGTEGDPKAVIGFSTTLSTFIMNGGTIWFDGPDAHPGSSTDDGLNGLDWEVGEGGLGRFEMHNDAVFRGGDDLKIAENAAGNGSCLIDGNARFSTGSGISISSGGDAEQIMVIAGNALVESGNSMGAGNPQGSTDEGYLTLSISGGHANLTIQDNAVLNFRVLSSRQGTTKFTVKNNGQVHIFDVLTGKGFIDNQTPPDRPEVVGGFNNTLSSEDPSDSTLTLQDNAQMTVNASAGLGISAPRDAGSAVGGKGLFIIRDQASFRVEQQLALGSGTQATTSDGTLEVTGPSAKITIGGNLNMAVDPDGNVVGLDANGNSAPGKATLSTVITSATHSTINVGGTARIGKGVLKVKLSGYTPVGGESYTLIKGGTIEGEFLQTDLSEAPLAAGLGWKVDYATDAVRLNVTAPPFVLGGVASVNLTSIVPDKVVFDTGSPNMDNWEPYASVLGNSVFLIEANTFALGSDGSVDASNQRYGLAFQPAAGGDVKLGNGFFADNGQAFPGQINLSRQNGNPGRVAGDTRPGAVNFAVGGETSLYGFPSAFNSDGRFNPSSAFYTALAAVSTGGRDASVQSFSLDPATLAQSMLSKAFDSAFGRCCTSSTPPETVSDQISRFGGDLAGLDNGNFVSVVEDRSKLSNPAGNAAAATIFRPDGSIVKEAFKIADGDLWSNLAAYKGGFAVRVAGVIYFYDNDGNQKGQVDQDAAAGSSFDRGRGDGTRLAGHINGPYVFLAGKGSDGPVRLAAFDSRDQKFAGLTVVNEGGLAGTFDRVNLAVDALNRVAVAYEVQPENYEQFQIALRVLNFDGTAKSFTALTKSFFPFVNNAATGIRTLRPSVAITTKQILVAGKGEINSANNPSAGPNTPSQTTIYTVVSHPDPKDDPTPPAAPTTADVPGKPEDNGATGKTATFYVNTPDTLNNGNTESLGVAIASNGNVIIGWEDDGEELKDLEAVWTLFDGTGKSITPSTQITTINPDFAGQTLTSKFLSYFRADKSAVAGRTSWGPKLHANLFGDGLGMGATSFELGIEVAELAAINVDAGGGGDFPSAQLLTNDGQPSGIVTGLSDADAEPEGDVRIADWEFLANGNIVVVGESRQKDDLVNKYGGSTPANHAIYRIVGPNGSEIKATALVSETPEGNEIWHGAAVTKDGFAIRFAQGGRAIVRLFNNSGTPVGGNIDLGTVAKDEAAAGGGRGDGAGFHGNGNDAYVAVNGAGNQVRLTVLNADGTLRYSRSATDVALKSVGRTDAAISPSAQVLVVFSATYDGGPVTEDGGDVSVVMGRLFDASGNPSGGTFYVSEKEVPTAKPLVAQNPRVAWRGDTAAVVWESENSGQLVDNNPVAVVAARLFTLGAPSQPLRITSVKAEASGLTITWANGAGPFLVQFTAALGSGWQDLVTTTERTVTVPMVGNAGFLRVADGTTKTVKLFKATLTPQQEVQTPAVQSSASGLGFLSLDGDKATYYVSFAGLGTDATQSHVHGRAPAGQNASVYFHLLPSPNFPAGTRSGILSGSTTVTAEQKAAIEAGETYFNVHTTTYGAGEIRGQLLQ